MVRSIDQAYAREVVAAIDRAYGRADEYIRKRGSIGASVAGSACIARLGLHLRGFPDDQVEPKRKRIFRAGNEIEKWVVSDLKKAGYDVLDKDEMTGKQYRRDWLGGHVVCYIDGLIELEVAGEKVWAILEVKSASSAMYAKIKKHGVRVTHRGYYGQVQTAMALFKMPLALFVIYNKDTSEYHCELIQWDQEEWDDIHTHLQAALDGQMTRITNSPANFHCRACSKTEVCWGKREVKPLCRFCQHAVPAGDGGWTCSLTGEPAVEPCEKYEQVKVIPKP